MQQNIAGCSVRYRQLTSAEQPGCWILPDCLTMIWQIYGLD
ncbi:MAG: hypothetical protein ACSLEM_03610 [Candidatus Malihini olakiniferum]